ncbi:MAG TPA: Uma2 family endonuclease [Thermoanaerobaculia bacterium]|nr:Uma2 family endonuclease [Thermoanaerobaculia bacterium]
MTVDARVVSAEELLDLPDDGWRYELVEGELRKMSPAGGDHGALALRIAIRFGSYVEQHCLGQAYSSQTGFVVSRDPDTVLEPDLAFVRAERVVRTPGFIPGPPDVAFEVVSPSDRYTELAQKIDRYLRAGTNVVVMVDPCRLSVTVHSLAGVTSVSDTLTLPDAVPGWSMTLDDIFGA